MSLLKIVGEKLPTIAKIEFGNPDLCEAGWELFTYDLQSKVGNPRH